MSEIFGSGEQGSKEDLCGPKRAEVEKAVKGGGDKEGHLLREGFIQVLRLKPDPLDYRTPSAEDLGNLGKIYKGARESAEKIEEEGEEAKLYTSISAIHEHVGSGKYEVEIQEENGNKEEQIRQKLLQDYGELDGLLADYYMRNYYEQKVEVSIRADRLENEIPENNFGINHDFVSRSSVRNQAYLYGLEAKKLSLVEDRLAAKIGEDSVEKELNTVEGFVGIDDRSSVDRDQLIKSAEKGFLEDPDYVVTEEDKGSFRNIDSDTKREILTSIAGSEIEIQHGRKKFSRAIEAGSSEEICEAASNIRSLQFEQKTEKSRMGVELSKQKAEDAWSRFKFAKRDLGKAIIGADVSGVKRLTNETSEKLKNALSERAKSWYERFKGKLEPVINGIREVGDGEKEFVVEVLNKVDEIVVQSISDFTEPVRNKFKEVGRWAKEGKTRIKAEAGKSRIERRKHYYTARHDLETWRGEFSKSSSVRVKGAKRQLWISLGEIVGGEGVYEHSKEVGKKVSKDTGDELVEIVKEAEEKLKKNPYFEKLNQVIDLHIADIGASSTKAPEVKEEPREVERPKKDDAEIEKITENVLLEDIAKAWKGFEIIRNIYKGNWKDYSGGEKRLRRDLKSLPREKRGELVQGYNLEYENALAGIEERLRTLNTHLNRKLGSEKSINIQNYSRYKELGEELAAIDEKLRDSPLDDRTIPIPERIGMSERIRLLKEYDSLLKKRYGKFDKLRQHHKRGGEEEELREEMSDSQAETILEDFGSTTLSRDISSSSRRSSTELAFVAEREDGLSRLPDDLLDGIPLSDAPDDTREVGLAEGGEEGRDRIRKESGGEVILLGETETTPVLERKIPSNSERHERVKGGDEREVFIDKKAFSSMKDDLSERGSALEVAGTLIGRSNLDSNTGKYWTEVTHYVSLPEELTPRSESSVQLSPDAWSHSLGFLDQLDDDSLSVVGWTHTHPKWGVFLSDHDDGVNEHFNSPHQIAVVYDPTIKNENEALGIFSRGGSAESREVGDKQVEYGHGFKMHRGFNVFEEDAPLDPDEIVISPDKSGERGPTSLDDSREAVTQARKNVFEAEQNFLASSPRTKRKRREQLDLAKVELRKVDPTFRE